MSGNLAMYPPQDVSNRFFTHTQIVQSQTSFQSLFAEVLNSGSEIDTMEAISIMSLFVNHVLVVERSPNVWSGQNDKLTHMVGFSRLERGIALPGTILDGRDIDWAYEMKKFKEWLNHMGLSIESHPVGHYYWSAQTHDKLLGNRSKVPCNGFYEIYKSKLIDYARLAYMAEYISSQLMQLAGRIKFEPERKIILFLSAVCKLGSVDLTFIMENKDFLTRDVARLIIEESAHNVGIVLKDCKSQPFEK